MVTDSPSIEKIGDDKNGYLLFSHADRSRILCIYKSLDEPIYPRGCLVVFIYQLEFTYVLENREKIQRQS